MWWVYGGFGVGTEWQMPNLWSAIGRPDLAEDARFNTNPNRLTNRQALTDIIESWMATFETDAEVMSALEGARVPYGPSLSPTDALTHPHFVERGLVRTVSDPLAGNVQIPGFPFKSTDPLPPDDHVAPALGEHNRDVLIGMAGLSEARVTELETKGVLASKPH